MVVLKNCHRQFPSGGASLPAPASLIHAAPDGSPRFQGHRYPVGSNHYV